MSDPEIYVIVHHQTADGHHRRAVTTINYESYVRSRFPGVIAVSKIDKLLGDVGAPGGEQGLQSDARGLDTPLPRLKRRSAP